MNLAKAFDTVYHSIILLCKLWHYGMKDSSYHCFYPYLSICQTCAALGSHFSDPESISFGITQFPTVGHLLFNIYIYNIYRTSQHLSVIVFADDTNLFVRHKDPYIAAKIFN